MSDNRYTLTQIVKMTGFKDHQVRNIETQCNLFFARDANNIRYFTDKDLEILQYIKQAREVNVPYKLIRTELEKRGLVEAQQQQAIQNTQLDKVTITDVRELLQNTLADVLKENQAQLVAQVEEKIEAMATRYEKKIDELASALEAQTKELAETRKKKGFISQLLGGKQ